MEAALTFLLSRYDLDVGLWDLVDPGLRTSLLSPGKREGSVPGMRLRSSAGLGGCTHVPCSVSGVTDLDVGVWDLVRDPGLRTSLLSPGKREVSPTGAAGVPEALQAEANERAAFLKALEERRRADQARAETARATRRLKEEDSRPRFHELRWPSLCKRNWRMWDHDPQWSTVLKAKAPGTEYFLPLGDPVQWSSFFPPAPILYFLLTVNKEHLVLRLKTPPLGFKGVPEYLDVHSDGLERISGQRSRAEVICRFRGQGWDSEPVGWDETLETIDAIVNLLSPTIGSVRSEAEEQFAYNQLGIEPEGDGDSDDPW